MRPDRRTKRLFLAVLGLAPAALAASLAIPGIAAAAGPITTAASCAGTTSVTCDLWAEPGTLALPGSSVPVWGFATTAGGSPVVPGPTIVVDEGASLTINLSNDLPQPTSLVVAGLDGAPDLSAVAASGGTHSFTFAAATPGTYLYEAGALPGSEYQVAMGLVGTLVVRPAGQPTQAYADASTSFGDEASIVLGEVDPALNNSTTPWTFDLRGFAPRYFLLNGRAFSSATPAIGVSSGNTVLLRYVNAGILHHSVGVLGVRQRLVAVDGSLLPAPRTMVAETFAPGQTADVLVSLPATATESTRYPVYDASLTLNNGSASGIGGMLAFLDAAGAAAGDGTGPVTSGVALDLGTRELTASVSDAATGGSTVQAAEYFVDTIGASGTGTAMNGAYGTNDVTVTATIPQAILDALSSGTHSIYVHGLDGASPTPNWGSLSSTTFVVDQTGPATSALALNPNPSNGAVAVALTGTASDATTGNANVVDAEYFIGTPTANGSGTHLTLNKTAPTVSLSVSIAAPVTAGTVSVHSLDAAGNWGPFATIDLVVDTAGPTTSSVAANPPANNGSYGQSSSNPSVRVTAIVTDVGSGGLAIKAAEGFIDVAVSNGTGFPLVAADGVFNGVTETVQADIPLSTINALSSGTHTFRIHGKDAVGNWGSAATLSYLIDRTAPTFTGITLSPNPTLGAATITLTVIGANDPLVGGVASGPAGGEYWIDLATPPAPGSGRAFTGSTASIPTASLSTGNHSIGARIRDAAGNWSTTTATATVFVVPDAIFANGFESGSAPWGWSSRSTTSTTRLNVTTSPALVDTRSLQAQGNNTNYVQYSFGTTAQPATPTYDARFVFRPNANASTGKDILAASTSAGFGTQLFHVRYRLSGTTPQVQLQVGSTANTTWANVNGGTANNTVEVVWQSGTTAQLFVNGTLVQTLAAPAGSVAAVRLGSVTSTGGSGLMYFDAFASKRTTTPYGP